MPRTIESRVEILEATERAATERRIDGLVATFAIAGDASIDGVGRAMLALRSGAEMDPADVASAAPGFVALGWIDSLADIEEARAIIADLAEHLPGGKHGSHT